MFSKRTQFEPASDNVQDLAAKRKAHNALLIDLTISNPGECGLLPETPATLGTLQSEEAMRYVPQAAGIYEARKAVAAMYGDTVKPADVLLTASTSEAYSMLFRVLCDPDDEVLIPQPGYPLFDMIAAFDSVVLKQYPLFRDHGWHIDFAALEAAITPRTRAIVVVHPNNPTGHATSDSERRKLAKIAHARGLALIVDEVFLEYPVEKAPGRSFAVPEQEFLSRLGAVDPTDEVEIAKTATAYWTGQPLTFVLSGLSKVCALPGMKVAWMVVRGAPHLASEAAYRLELVADTFLSVAMPQQVALSKWLAARGDVQAKILDRVRANLAELDRQIAGTAINRLSVEGGWCAVLRVPAIIGDEELAAGLVRETGVLVQPGSLYGFPTSGWLVVSLLIPVDMFAIGISLLVNGIKMSNRG